MSAKQACSYYRFLEVNKTVLLKNYKVLRPEDFCVAQNLQLYLRLLQRADLGDSFQKCLMSPHRKLHINKSMSVNPFM